jgi:hypothetical protein
MSLDSCICRKYIDDDQIPEDMGGSYSYDREAELSHNKRVAACHEPSKHPDPDDSSHLEPLPKSKGVKLAVV